MRTRSGFIAVGLILVAFHSPRAQPDSDLLAAAAHIRIQRYAEAESTLNVLWNSVRGDLRYEALFMLAGLKKSPQEAQGLYRRIIEENPRGQWSKRAYLELSKIEFALGNYNESLHILHDSGACSDLEEACLFYGLAAIMLKRYEDARRPLSNIRKGKLRTWAYLSLAEVESGLNHPDEACRRYEALSSAMISPTASYRYAECLEDRGDIDGASEEFIEIIENFRDTPEAVLAAEKLQMIASARSSEEPVVPDDSPVLTSGFTIQFGSFRDRGNAIKLASKIKRIFPGVRVDTELIKYIEHHRVRYGYFKTREEARIKGEEIARELNEDFTVMTLP